MDDDLIEQRRKQVGRPLPAAVVWVLLAVLVGLLAWGLLR